MTTETWLPVVGYEELYEISSLGNVKSLLKNRLMKPGFFKGYVRFGLTKNGVCKTVAAHRMVLEAFIGPCPARMESCHNNGKRNDNRLNNLRWDTHLANMADKDRHGTNTWKWKKGRKYGALSKEEIARIQEAALFGAKLSDLSAVYETDFNIIRRAARFGLREAIRNFKP